MKKVMSVFGTRPEAIKMCPVVKELQKRKNIHSVVCVTGQHRELLLDVLRCFSIQPDYDLAIMRDGQSLFDITGAILHGIERVLTQERPDLVLVHGDTTTAFITGLACFYLHIPVGHIEAGMRTHDLLRPFPEEFNRRAIAVLADLHFAPTAHAKKNLQNEGVSAAQIFVTGNTAIDALHSTIKADYSHPALDWAADSRLLLITLHRRESVGAAMHSMTRGIRRAIERFSDCKAILPAHPNPMVREAIYAELAGCKQVQITAPLPPVDFHNFLARCHLVLTDSGGVQEEAPALGKPVLVLRDTTERSEGIAAGTLRLIGTTEESVYEGISLLLRSPDHYQKMASAQNPYGDGTAAKQIADVIENA